MPTARQFDAILPFLDRLRVRCSPKECEDLVSNLLPELYDNRWILYSDWGIWKQEAAELLNNPERIDLTDATTIRKLLTVHARQDHFCEGHFLEMVMNGHILRLLERVENIKKKLELPQVRNSASWDGVLNPKLWAENYLATRHKMADAARQSHWDTVFKILDEHPELVNSFRPGGTARYSPLHQAAHAGVGAEIIDRLVERGAWRTLQNARGERPVDVAKRNGKEGEIQQLTPWVEQEVPIGILLKIQSHFHAVISGRIKEMIRMEDLRLPELEPILEMDPGQRFWFLVPGMYGGFEYYLAQDGVEAKLVSTSWCRVVEGSTEIHEITSAGAKMMEQPPPKNWITFVDEK
jgi:hypothetical protein